MRRRRRKSGNTKSVSTTLDRLRPDVLRVVLRRAALIVRRQLRRDQGVLSTGFGYKVCCGIRSSKLSLRIYVRRKLVKLAASQTIPSEYRLRIQVRRIRYTLSIVTDVIEAPRILRARPQALQAPRVFNGNDPDEYGTATAIVTTGGAEFVLSAGHVVGRTLKVPKAPLGELVWDGAGDQVGLVYLVPSVVDTSLDAALVRASGDRRINVPRPGRAPVTAVCPVEDLLSNAPGTYYKVLSYRRFRVAKFHGVIPDYTVDSQYAEGTVTFPELLEFEVRTEGGDSGALVIDDRGRGVGLHILGESSDTDRAYAIPIGAVLQNLLPNGPLRLIF